MKQLPHEWSYRSLGDIAAIVRGSSPRPAGDPKFFNGDYLPWITVGDVTSTSSMYLERTQSFLTPAGAEHTRILEKDTLILTNSGATLGVPKIIKIKAGANDGIAAFLSIKDASKEFLYFFLQSKTTYFREKLAPGVGQPNLNTELIGSVDIALPPLAEQEKIASILTRCDHSIEKLEQFIVAKAEFKRGLMQQLLTGRKRFKEFDGQKWKQCHLGDIAIESELRNNGRLTEKSLYAVTKAYGMIPMRERVQGESVERCKIVSKDWFAYNPMRLNIGSIAKWNGEEDVLVSPDYVVFKCDETRLDPDFLNHYRRSHRWAKFVEKAGDGSVRVRIWFSHLAELKLSLPPLPEQRRIAAVLNACDRELDMLREQLVEFKNQKKGLMQKLLTGQIRVKVDQAQAIGV